MNKSSTNSVFFGVLSRFPLLKNFETNALKFLVESTSFSFSDLLFCDFLSLKSFLSLSCLCLYYSM